MSESGSENILCYIVSAPTFYLTIGSMLPKRRMGVFYGTRCVGLCRGPRITCSVSPPEQERFLTDNEIIEHVTVRPDGKTMSAVG